VTLPLYIPVEHPESPVITKLREVVNAAFPADVNVMLGPPLAINGDPATGIVSEFMIGFGDIHNTLMWAKTGVRVNILAVEEDSAMYPMLDYESELASVLIEQITESITKLRRKEECPPRNG
jgi:hypothetical protein